MQLKTSLCSFRLWLSLTVLTISGQNVGATVPADLPASLDGLTITSSETEIIPNMTDHLKVTCKYSKPENSRAMSVNSFIISYWDNVKRSFEDLITVTSVKPDQVKVPHGIAATVSGHLDQNGESFLTLEWTYPDKNVATRYLCSVLTIDKTGQSLTTNVSVQVNIESIDVSSLMKEMLILKKEVVELNKKLEEQNKEQENEKKELNKKLDFLKSRSMSTIESGITIDNQSLYWFDKAANSDTAKIMCWSTGGKLAEIPYEKLQANASKLKAAGMKNNYYWIGLIRFAETGPWVWASDSRDAPSMPWDPSPSDGRLGASFLLGKSGFYPDALDTRQYVLCTRPV